QIELGAAERFDAAGFVDHLDRELGRGDAADADLRHTAGGWIQRADVDGIGSPAAQGHRAEGAGDDRTRCLEEKFTAAWPPRQQWIGVALVAKDGLPAIFFHIDSPCAIPAQTSVCSTCSLVVCQRA